MVLTPMGLAFSGGLVGIAGMAGITVAAGEPIAQNIRTAASSTEVAVLTLVECLNWLAPSIRARTHKFDSYPLHPKATESTALPRNDAKGQQQACALRNSNGYSLKPCQREMLSSGSRGISNRLTAAISSS